MQQTISRGDIYYAGLHGTQGSEQDGVRPVLVISNDIGNFHSPTVIIAPLTTKRKNNLPTHTEISTVSGLDANSITLAEQLRTIDKSRLGRYIGRICADEQVAIDKAIAISVGLKERSGCL